VCRNLKLKDKCDPHKKKMNSLEMDKRDNERAIRSSIKESRQLNRELKTMEADCLELGQNLQQLASELQDTDVESSEVRGG
jgi:hypothetical protein